jgi:hypothetical protein
VLPVSLLDGQLEGVAQPGRWPLDISGYVVRLVGWQDLSRN